MPVNHKLKFVSILLILFSSSAFSSAYQIFEQDGLSLGNNHAGSASSANSAATQWYNPAGMTRLKKQEMSIGGEIVNAKIKYTGTQTNGAIVPLAPSSSFSSNGGTLTFIPNMHYVTSLNDNLAFGVGILVPFGAETDYDSKTPLRYNATKTTLQVVDVTPALGYKLSPALSIGAGADITYVTGVFDNISTLSSNAFDSSSKNEGKAFALGYHVGTLLEINQNNRIGFTYHSKIVANLKGRSDLSVPLGAGKPADNDFSTKIILPAWWDLSYYLQATNKLALMATIAYTQWHSVRDITLNNVVGVNTGTISVIVPENLSNTWNFAIGSDYQVDSKWTIMGGVGYDMTPTNNTDRTVQMPDQDRFTLATGVTYKFSDALTVALSYAHFFVRDASINSTVIINGASQTTNGKTNASADLVGMQVQWKI